MFTSLVTRSLRWTAVALAAASSVLGANAWAQDANENWNFSAGLGVVSQPKYPGSGDTKASALPMLSASHGRYVIGALPGAGVPAGVGAFLVQDAHWRVGVGLGGNLDKPRKESDSARLHGMGDISATALGSVFASYSDSWWKVGGNVVTDLAGKDQGTRATLDLEASYSPVDRLMLTAGPSVTWADSKYTQTFFGVTAAQSASSGLATYTAKSGINSISFNIGANYQLTQQWGLGARLSASSLRGDAADSPITEKKSQTTLGVFANYRF